MEAFAQKEREGGESMEKNIQLFPELARAVKFKIPIKGDLFLRQCAAGMNMFHLPASYRYPTGNIAGYFISLNWNDEFIVLEKERKENNEYFIIDRLFKVVSGPFTWEKYEAECQKKEIELPMIHLSELDWIINI